MTESKNVAALYMSEKTANFKIQKLESRLNIFTYEIARLPFLQHYDSCECMEISLVHTYLIIDSDGKHRVDIA